MTALKWVVVIGVWVDAVLATLAIGNPRSIHPTPGIAAMAAVTAIATTVAVMS